MKIEIDLAHGCAYILQMEAIDNYIKLNTISEDITDFMGIPVSKYLNIRECYKFATKVKAKHKEFYITCRKTKKGLYKFTVRTV